MVAMHTEGAFEAAIEAHLLAHGYLQGNKHDFDLDLAIDPAQLVAFIEASQPGPWERLGTIHGPARLSKFLARLAKELDARGTLGVLRHGIIDYGVKIDLAYFKPAHSMAPELAALYGKNRLSVTRQLRYSVKHANELDLVLFINGLPMATVELKNQLTGQTVQHAITQYRMNRDPRDLLLAFKRRALVHFAVDPDEVYMTTRLAGADTIFLPFNRGRGTGAGNPDNPTGYRTAYLWEQVWERDSWLDIAGRFIHLEVTERVEHGKKVRSERILFPRYHQLDGVRKMEAHARAFGAGQHYLIQHSAGSGKSNSIAWLAHRLANLHSAADEQIFSSVIVITDRRVLDKQLQDTVYQFEHAQGVVEKIDDDSAQLARALEAGRRIIITTLQKFPFVLEKTTAIAGRRFAVIVDEAHSSQTGEAAKQLKEVLSRHLRDAGDGRAPGEDQQEPESDDEEDQIVNSVQARGRQKHISFFAFTATPKFKTLAIFGTQGADGRPHPFHLYAMRQAIEEGFILDVLKNYVTYKTFYRLERAGQDDPEVDPGLAGKVIARFVSLHPHNIAQKTEVIIEHFRQHTRGKIGGRAKAMVVTRSRLHAVRYKVAFDAYLREKGYADLKVLIAFSGTVIDGPAEYTEPQMNGFAESQLPKKFKTDDYQVLIVAEKYQTGFDEPLLHTMYVDKRLDGVKAVQTLSRLNRRYAGKEDTFVLDFVNDAEGIQEAFKPYYEVTQLAEATDPNLLYDLKAKLDGSQVYWPDEVRAFSQAFFQAPAQQSSAAPAALHRAIDPAVSRFRELEEPAQDEFRKRLESFVRLYAFLSQIIVFQDYDLERLYAYGRFLLRKLPQRTGTEPDLGVDVRLEYYRLSKTGEQAIALAGEVAALSGPAEVGTGGEGPLPMLLSSIITALNDRFGTEFSAADQLVFDQIEEVLVANEDLAQQAKVNSVDNYRYGFETAFEDAIVDRRNQNDSIFTRISDDHEFAGAVKAALVTKVYERQQIATAP